MANDSERAPRRFRKLAVIGAGNMGSGIAQKIATEGFDVRLVDLDDEKVSRGIETIRTLLAQGVERKIFRPDQVDAILGRIEGTSNWSELSDVDLAVEAVFEDLEVKRGVFARLEEHCRDDAILATNTSSFLVGEIAQGMRRPERAVGLHYFFHPAKNRLVEVIPGERTSAQTVDASWALQEQIGKTPIASLDASGFVVNRYFVPWLNEAVRLLEEGVAGIPTIEQACKKTFGIGMGPFELMNVTGVPIALHAATTLGKRFGPFYAPAAALRRQVESGSDWELGGEADPAQVETVADRMLAVVFLVAAQLVDEGVGSIEDTDIGARVGLRWPRGPFQMINRRGVVEAAALCADLARRWDLELPNLLRRQVEAGTPFAFRLVKCEQREGIATLTVNRPDAMNALNEDVVAQLDDAFRRAAADDKIRGIVIAGAGKAFIAGADIRFFVRNIEKKDLDRIVRFTERGQSLLAAIDDCAKPVVARLHGLALGGGLELALACDAIVATPRSTVAFPETGIGIYPGLGGTQRAPRKIGAGLAKWLIYTGRMLPAVEAHSIGLIDAVVDHADLDAAIVKLIDDGIGPRKRPQLGEQHAALESFFASAPVDALREGRVDLGGDERLAKAAKPVGFKAPIALRLAERLIDEGGQRPLAEGLRLELDHLREIFTTRDAYEGLSSLGRRRPSFEDK